MSPVIDRKKKLAKQQIAEECGCKVGCTKCSSKRAFIDSMSDCNIPEAYWMLSYADFKGSPHIKSETELYIKSLTDNYRSGKSLCYAGSPGTGKTMSACTILKAALAEGYLTYYTSLSDLAFYLTDFNYKTSYYHQCTRVDFLCIDEVDARHFAETDNSENYFARSLERIFRYRVQNRLPIIFATNHSNMSEVFTGQFKKIFDSISAPTVHTISALGVDHRLKKAVK